MRNILELKIERLADYLGCNDKELITEMRNILGSVTPTIIKEFVKK